MKQTGEPHPCFQPQLWGTLGHLSHRSSPSSLAGLPGSMVPANRRVPPPSDPPGSGWGPFPCTAVYGCLSFHMGSVTGQSHSRDPQRGREVYFQDIGLASESQTKPKNTAHCPRHHFAATDGFGLSPLFCGSAEKCPLTQDVILKSFEMSNHPLA